MDIASRKRIILALQEIYADLREADVMCQKGVESGFIGPARDIMFRASERIESILRDMDEKP